MSTFAYSSLIARANKYSPRNEVDYRGVDLDTYDQDFINDEAVESGGEGGEETDGVGEVDAGGAASDEGAVVMSDDEDPVLSEGPVLSDIEPEEEQDEAVHRLASTYNYNRV